MIKKLHQGLKDKALDRKYQSFLNTISPKSTERVKKILSRKLRFKGELKSNKNFISGLVTQGHTPKLEEWKEFSRRIGRDVPKTSWKIAGEHITKTEADFAQYLIDNNVSLDAVSLKGEGFSKSSIKAEDKSTPKKTIQEIMASLTSFVLKDRPKEFKGVSTRRLGRLVMKLSNELNINPIFDKDGDVYLYKRNREKDFSPEKLILDATLTEAIEYLREKVSEKYSKIVTLDAINSLTTPSEDITIGTHQIIIESKRGTVRSGTDENGNDWANTMIDDYGYFNDTHGNDGDEIDVFVSSDADIKDIPNKPVFYLKQNHKDGKFDEDKFILGTSTLKEAKEVYYRNYDKGYKNSGSWHEVEFSKLGGLLKKLSEIYIKRG